MAAADLGTAEWERSKVTNQDVNLLKRLGLMKKEDAIRFPSEESYPNPPMEYRPMIKDLLRIGAQFVGYREYANKTEEKLAEANERANTLAQQLEHSEKARKKAELDATEARAEADKAKVREYLDFCTRTLSLVYGTMFPRNKMPETLPALMDKFRDAPRIHGFVRAQLAAGARFAMIMIKICYPKLDVGQVVPKCLEKMSKKKRNFGKYDDIVTPVAEDMMDELLRMDSILREG
ncbi:hypothetical protein QYE76_004659 [Lolium multiflorum]|uniref:Uncharacterized protein n=1 Tax=Lolium multiflorum TaxID=4521 RepID=A0AAD8RT92_LOLMU|nr:hypothetical protein QYE76_004659 [Lolium multiflorum]